MHRTAAPTHPTTRKLIIGPHYPYPYYPTSVAAIPSLVENLHAELFSRIRHATAAKWYTKCPCESMIWACSLGVRHDGIFDLNIEVKDPVKFAEYREKAAPLIKKFGGRYIIRGGDLRRLEGNPPLNRLVALEFPTVEVAQRFYDSAEYQPILKLRLDSTRSDTVLAEGYSG